MKNQVLYCGDGHLKSAGRYIYNLLGHLGFKILYVPSHKKFQIPALKPDIIILSDYPSSRLSKAGQQWILEQVKRGCGFLMLGGFGSFHGMDGLYHTTALRDMLPVDVSSTDDRCHAFEGVTFGHEWTKIAQGKIPSTVKTPAFCGYNQLFPKQDAAIKLTLVHLDAAKTQNPLYVIRPFGKGIAGAYASDFSPHWCGGLVDWGRQRVSVKTAETRPVEVGDYYIQWFHQILLQVMYRLL